MYFNLKKILIIAFLVFAFNSYPQTHHLTIKGNEYELNWRKLENGRYYCNLIIDIILEQKVIGNIHYEISTIDKAAFISRFIIDKDHRGIGESILKYVCRVIIKDLNYIELYPSPFELEGSEFTNMLPRLIKFYKRCGFESKENSNFLYYKKRLNFIPSSL